MKQGLIQDFPSELCALTAKLQRVSLLSAMNPALFFLSPEQMNCFNIYPGSWTKFYSLGELWPSLERAWMRLHHSRSRDLTGFCWASLLVCMKRTNAAPDLSHASTWEPFGLFLKSAWAHYESLKNRWPSYFQLLIWILKKKSIGLTLITNHQTTFFLHFKNPHILNPSVQGLHSCA